MKGRRLDWRKAGRNRNGYEQAAPRDAYAPKPGGSRYSAKRPRDSRKPSPPPSLPAPTPRREKPGTVEFFRSYASTLRGETLARPPTPRVLNDPESSGNEQT